MEFKRIDVQEARGLLAAAPGNGLQIIDIRDEQSYANGHISSALHIDNNSVQPFVENADTSKPLLVYCYHGNMSRPQLPISANRASRRPIVWMVVSATGKSTLPIRLKPNRELSNNG